MSSKDVDFKIVDLIISTGALPKEVRNDAVFHDCIHELSALPMYRLSSEPSYLRDCHRRIIEENHKLAFDNYSTFIQTAECTKQIFDDFEVVENKNSILSNKIPEFVSSCNCFVEKCRKSISVANLNRVALKNHNQILEILEIPQLLEACIRNNYIDEALEMIAHARKLERRHQNISIITNVAHESKLAAQKLLDQLFLQLGGNLQLPACLKIVGYLRRMDCLPDPLLRMKFLQCRDNYLKNLLRSLSHNDPFFHATKYMEITRVNLFDIATQYRAVFNDEDIYLTNSDNDGSQLGMLFSSWLVMRVRNFMLSLSEDLEQIIQNSVDYSHTNKLSSSSNTSSQSIGSKLQSLLGQAMYFGLSLSRIGSDFRSLLMPMFYQAIMKYVNMRLDEIPDSFSECISSYKWTVNIENEEILCLSSVIQATEEIFRAQKSEEISPPVKLMNHPLLAMLANQMLSILEDIRLCCPRVLKERIYQSFTGTIAKLMNCLSKFYQEEKSNFSTKEQKLFLTMLSVFLCNFLPHIDLCLTALFATNLSNLLEETHALNVGDLSNYFQGVLPDSFYLQVTEEDIIVDDLLEDKSSEEISKNGIIELSSYEEEMEEENEHDDDHLIIDDDKVTSDRIEQEPLKMISVTEEPTQESRSKLLENTQQQFMDTSDENEKPDTPSVEYKSENDEIDDNFEESPIANTGENGLTAVTNIKISSVDTVIPDEARIDGTGQNLEVNTIDPPENESSASSDQSEEEREADLSDTKPVNF